MYQVGQKVIYGIHGVCCITAVEVKCSGKEKKEFYCLEPVEQPGAVFFVPTANPAAVSKLRPILTREEFDVLITTQKEREVIWIEDENQRKQRYRELIAQNDRGELISMVSALYRHKRSWKLLAVSSISVTIISCGMPPGCSVLSFHLFLG